MKLQKTTKDARLAFFRSLYDGAKTQYADALSAFDRQMAQYRGSTEIDGSGDRAGTVRNITYEIVESEVSSEIPSPKVEASAYSEHRDRCAKSIERLLTAVRDRLPFEEMNDLDERYTYIYGGSVRFIEWDSTLENGRGGVRIHVLSPKCLIPQPGVCRVEDMDYCFLRFVTTRAELARRYSLTPEEEEKLDVETDTDATLPDGEIATVILCFYRAEDGEIGEYAFSGETELCDLPAYYRRKNRVCRSCGKFAGLCTCAEPRFVLEDQTEEEAPELAGDAFRGLRIPYYTPRRFPIVIRRNTSGEGLLFGQSDCDFLRPEQQAINKVESRILQKLLRAGITPIVPEDATVSLNNAVFGQVIKMKPGESAAQYGKVDTTPDISQDIAEAERLYLHAKRILGISDAFMGISGSASESGYAKQLQIAQASGRLESKKKMKHTAYADMDRIIFEYYLAFADEGRFLTFRDAYGRIHNAEFRRYDFLSTDPGTGEIFYDDDYLFSVDLNGASLCERAELWERNLENLRSGALGDPKSPKTLLRYWQCQERAHYPFARENVEYFLDTLREDESGVSEA